MRQFLIIASFCALSLREISADQQWAQVKSKFGLPERIEYLDEFFAKLSFIHKEPRIVGGRSAKLGQIPHQALLYLKIEATNETFICGGSIIGGEYILTAAHCLEGIDTALVYAGLIDRTKDSETLKAVVNKENFIIHERYDSEMISNDIALIKVPEIKFDENIKKIDLPNDDELSQNLTGKSALISGWGKVTDRSGASTLLQYAYAPIVSNSACRVVYGRSFVLDSNICLDTKAGKSACSGDSGGGLLLKINDRDVLSGVVSFGSVKGCQYGIPCVFTKVASYRNWIREKTAI